MPKLHILRGVRETTWTSCGCFTEDALPPERAHEATCYICRAAYGLPKTLRLVELPGGVIYRLYFRDHVKVFQPNPDEPWGPGWETVCHHGRWEQALVYDIRAPMVELPDYREPSDLWGQGAHVNIGGYHIIVLRDGTRYGALKSRRPLDDPEVPPTLETAAEAPQNAGKTWLERLACPDLV